MNKMTLQDIDIKDKKVIVRVDFNVPLSEEGKITDDTRIRSALPTINYLREKGALVILMSHMGRPKGQVNEKYRMAPVAAKLEELLGEKVYYAKDCIGNEPREIIAAMKPGNVLLLENLRFHQEEEKNDPNFARSLADLADIYVNDAFGAAHRAHASTEGITRYLPAVAGFLMQTEINTMSQALEKPERPFIAILGGAKVSDKIGVIQNLLHKVDVLVTGGGMANTFLAALGKDMGKSLVEKERIDLARTILEQAEKKDVEFILPTDLVVADAFAPDANYQVVSIDKVPAGWMAMDIGPETCLTVKKIIKNAQTVIWNGPMGVFEMDAFAKGTEETARAIADSQALSIVGGGDSAAAVHKAQLASKITHVSTGGGASLKFLEGKVLPGVAALLDKVRLQQTDVREDHVSPTIGP
ncbi:MAG: phosphoglycerate kinase [Bacillota bacterium]|jgi:phosphoglycerate kinase